VISRKGTKLHCAERMSCGPGLGLHRDLRHRIINSQALGCYAACLSRCLISDCFRVEPRRQARETELQKNLSSYQTGLSLPFPFFSKRWERKAHGLGGEMTKERRPRTPADVALVARGLQLRSRSGWKGEKTPPECQLRRGLGTGRRSRIRILASAFGPASPAGRFRRGATRGERDGLLLRGVGIGRQAITLR
jgi:hypothetical protein